MEMRKIKSEIKKCNKIFPNYHFELDESKTIAGTSGKHGLYVLVITDPVYGRMERSFDTQWAAWRFMLELANGYYYEGGKRYGNWVKKWIVSQT